MNRENMEIYDSELHSWKSIIFISILSNLLNPIKKNFLKDRPKRNRAKISQQLIVNLASKVEQFHFQLGHELTISQIPHYETKINSHLAPKKDRMKYIDRWDINAGAELAANFLTHDWKALRWTKTAQNPTKEIEQPSSAGEGRT